MSFDVAIKVDPGDSLAKIKGVETGLAAAEAKGKQAGQAMLGVSKAFQSLGEAVRKEQEALRRTSEIHDRLTRQASPLAQGFAKIAEQIEREKRALESIRGPGLEAIRTIRDLSSLLAKGAITASEFNAKLHAIRPPSNFRAGAGGGGAGFDASAIAGALPGGSIIAGAVGGGVAGAATAGIQTAIGGAGQIIALADAYTGLNNRLKALTGSQSEATELFNKLHASANRTYSDVNTTTDSFVKFARALKGLGVSQNDTIAFTERLNMVIAQSGADSTGANAAMLQLSQALSSGVLRGEEFNSIIEQAPALLDPIAKHLGVNVGQLRALAQQGKITSKVIYDSFVEAGPAIEKSFGEAVPTVSQQFQRLKNDIAVSVGEMAKSAELGKATASVLSDLKTVIAATTEQTKLLSQGLNEVGLSFGDLASGGASGFRSLIDGFDQLVEGTGRAQKANVQYVDQVQVVNRFVAAATGTMNEFAKEQARASLEMTIGREAAEKFAGTMKQLAEANAAWDIAKPASGLAAIYGELESAFLNTGRAIDKLNEKKKAHHIALSAEEQMLNRIRGPLYEQSQGLATVALALGNATINQAEYNEELYRLMSLTGDEGKLFKSVADQMGGISSAIKPMDVPSVELPVASKAQEDLATKAEESAARMEKAWASGAGSIAGSLISAFASGEQSISEMVEGSLQKLAILALRMAAMQMGGPAGSFLSAAVGAIGGGANGFDYVANSNKLQLPGFATGGDFMVGGSGGTDSKIAMFRVTPGESVHVRTPAQQQQQMTQGGAAQPRIVNVVQVQSDPREVTRAIGSRSGQREVVELNRKFNRRG